VSALCHTAWLLEAVSPNVTVAFFCNVKPDTKEDREAEAVAIASLIPFPLMTKLLASEEYAADHSLPAELPKSRRDLFATYGI